MSYLEVKKRNDIEYASFVKKFSLMGHNFRIREHIGKNISTLNEKEYLKNNLDSITQKEYNLRKSLISDLDIVYNENLLYDVELKSIHINNLWRNSLIDVFHCF